MVDHMATHTLNSPPADRLLDERSSQPPKHAPTSIPDPVVAIMRSSSPCPLLVSSNTSSRQPIRLLPKSPPKPPTHLQLDRGRKAAVAKRRLKQALAPHAAVILPTGLSYCTPTRQPSGRPAMSLRTNLHGDCCTQCVCPHCNRLADA